jgi:tetratricopeptide (TPR) repeat protein
VRPQLIILGSCESAGDGQGAALLALGPRLAAIGVPAVLAMQARITMETLRGFLPACLRELERDGRIDAAVAVARGAVRERPDFWAPVLFQRLLSGRLWLTSGVEVETPEELLERMPVDEVPVPQALPIPHRMPLRPNPLFVGRERELREVAQLLKEGERVVILVGIGGVGKTQLAVELAHRYGSSFAGGVFWVSCADPNGIAAEVAACGQLLGLSLTGLDLEVQVRLTRAAWETELPRLLIFDTCEEEQVLRQWLPTSGGARVIVTSRKQRGWSPDLPVALLPVKELARAESVALLQHLAPRLSAKEAYQIAGVLGDLPLALHLSGYYLARYHIAVATYLAKLVNVPLQHISLQGHQVQGMPTNEEPHVERAFALSLSRLEANNLTDDLARQLLIRAACFAPGEPFRREWLEATVTLEGDDEAQMLVRTDAVERLFELGFVEPIGLELLRLHRLLAAYTVQTLHDQAAAAAVERVIGDEADKANGTTVPAPMQPVLPHLRHLVQRADGREDVQVARLVQALGEYFDLAGSYEEARAQYKRALDIRERVLGATHPDTATSLSNLAGILGAQGAYREARELLERALAIREQVLGRDHPDTARSLNGLANLLRAQGACGEARPLVERALAIRERVLGTDHPDTARSLNSLATLLQHQGAYEEARALYERALGSIERKLGADHPVTATLLNNLASLHQQQGSYEKARALYKRALDIRERVLGADHPDTAQVLNRLAMLEQAQGAAAQALPYYHHALAIYAHVLGPAHPTTRASCDLRRLCLAAAQLGPVPAAGTQEARIRQVMVQARAAIDAALADPAADRYVVATAIEARARWAEEGQAEGLPELVLAAELRALIPRLGVTPDDPDAL